MIFTKSHDDIARFFVGEPDDDTIEVPSDLVELQDSGRLRIVAGEVVDIADHGGPFYVDPDDDFLLKHVTPAAGRVEVACLFDAKLVRTAQGTVAVEDLSFRLNALKARLRADVDANAERERLKYITGGAGQAMTYQRKVEEARKAVAEVDPLPADYPLLAASIGIDGATVAEVADVVLQMDAQWAIIGAAIEAVRLGAKRAIDLAEDEAAARAVTPAWP